MSSLRAVPDDQAQHRRARVFRLDYKTLVAAIGVLVCLAVLLSVLDGIDARKDAARDSAAKDQQIARRDAALSQAQRAADEAAAQSRANGEQIAALIAQVKRQNDLVAQQQGVVSALRNELAKRGISTVVEGGRVRVVPGPVSTASSSNVRATSASPGKGGGSQGPAPAPRTATVTTTRTAAPTRLPTVAPLPSPTLSLPLMGDILGTEPTCVLLVCVNSEGTP